MNKKIIALMSFLMIFGVLISSYANAGSSSFGSSGSFDVSVDRVRANGRVLADSSTNLVPDADVFSLIVDFTALETLENAHIQAVLRGRSSGDVVSDSTNIFDLAKNQSSSATLTLALIDSLKRETDFDLTIKIIDAEGRSEQKSYGITTKRSAFISRGLLDVSIDRVKANGKVVAESRSNFIDKSNDFDVLVEFTALEDLVDAHVDAVIKDLNSGNVVADASTNFDLLQDSSSSKLLTLELLDNMKHSDSFELTVKIIDAEGHSVQKVYGLRMQRGSLPGIGFGRTLDISIDSVEADKKTLAENENNFVIISENEKELDVRVSLTSLEDVKDAHVDVVLAFENGDVVSDATSTFDINRDIHLSKVLKLPLISRFEQNNFKLKVRIVDADGNSEEKSYGLKISQNKFPFVISSISLSPENSVEAGKNLIARLRFKNSGVIPLDGITARVSIPELGVSSTKFIDQIKNSQLPEVSEEFILNVLDGAATGTYTVRSEITSQFSGETEAKEIPVFIVGKAEQPQELVNDKLIISIPIAKQDVFDDREVIYPITLKNEGPDSNSYTLLLDGGNWANLRLSESNTFVLKTKESVTLNIYTSAKTKTLGDQIFIVTVKSDDSVLKQIPLKGNVVASGKSTLAATLKSILEVILIGAAVFLAAVGLFFGIKRYIQGGKGESEPIGEEIPDQAEGEAYY